MKTVTGVFSLFINLILCSCNQSIDMNFDDGKDDYMRAVSCLDSNYAKIFSSNDKSLVDVYNSERVSNQLCENILQLLEKRSVSIVTYDRDSTVFFYSKPSEGIKSKQSILVFAKDKSSLEKKLSSDVKIKSTRGEGWYELEKIISLAN